jgi:FkbM family methyltransferase
MNTLHRRLRKLANSAVRFFRRRILRAPEYAYIGRYRIRLASNSQWSEYRRSFHLYDTALAAIADVVAVKYPDLRSIDIGANVGDTAALIRQSRDIPVLCIEGDLVVLPTLKENLSKLGAGVELEASFVGPENIRVNPDAIEDVGRNARLLQTADPQGGVTLRSLQAILVDHPFFEHPKLVKIDTEGFDFRIISHSLNIIRKSHPVIFFEYDPHFTSNEPCTGIQTIEALITCGYSDFIFYDNFGNYLLHATPLERQIFRDLDRYLLSNRRHGIAVYYFDVCAIHADDAELAEEIRVRTQAD